MSLSDRDVFLRVVVWLPFNSTILYTAWLFACRIVAYRKVKNDIRLYLLIPVYVLLLTMLWWKEVWRPAIASALGLQREFDRIREIKTDNIIYCLY